LASPFKVCEPNKTIYLSLKKNFYQFFSKTWFFGPAKASPLASTGPPTDAGQPVPAHSMIFGPTAAL
jgi:hypothetical protein